VLVRLVFCLQLNTLVEVVMKQVGYAKRLLVKVHEFLVRV